MKVLTYRYFWKDTDGLKVRFLTDSEEGHKEFMDKIMSDTRIESACREYINEIDYTKICIQDTFKIKCKEVVDEKV